MEVDNYKTLPDNKLTKEAKSIAAKYIGEGTPKAVSHTHNVMIVDTLISFACGILYGARL